MKVAIAADHAGFSLKECIIRDVLEGKCVYYDYGVHSDEPVDYPDVLLSAVRVVADGEYDYAIVICGSGVGASIVANKVKGIRAALCMNEYLARYSRLHNDANVLALGARVLGVEIACSIVSVWLDTAFESGQHLKRVEKIKRLEDL